MKFLYNESSALTSIYIKGANVKLEPYGHYALNNDQESIKDATGWCLRFTNLKLVDKNFIDQLNANRSPVSNVLHQTQTVSKQDVGGLSNSPVNTLQNEKGEVINVYEVPVINSNGVIVDKLSIMFNEDVNSLVLSTKTNLKLVLVEKANKQVQKAAAQKTVAEETNENKEIASETEENKEIDSADSSATVAKNKPAKAEKSGKIFGN